MPDNEAEKKNIARLDFNIGDAEGKLNSINKLLEDLSKKSETYAKQISDNLNKGFNSINIKDNLDISKNINTTDYQNKLKTISGYTTQFGQKARYTLSGTFDFSKMIDVNKFKKDFDNLESIGKSGAKKLTTVIMQEETKTAANRQRNLDNYQAAEKKANLEVITSEAKKADKIEVIAAETEAYKERKAYASALKQEEYNNRVLKSTKTLYDQISQYAKTYIIYQGFNKLKQAITETIDEMVKVQYEMVQIDRVLNESSLNINKYRDELLQLAYDYGNSFDSVSDATLRLAQAGFDSQESLALTEKTLLALNTAELNATEATDDMVAIMAQWGLMTGSAAEQAQKYGEIIDKINKVADNYPTTSADILDALKKMSSGFNLAGASIDETIALFVAAEKASQRGGKAIGTALSNITQQLKDEGRLTIAESLGLDFYTDETKQEFKNIIDIFGEMSEKMQELKNEGKENSVEMQNLLSIFTVFRRNIGSSLLGEMAGKDSTYAQVLEDVQNSIGYSLQENEKHMKTAKAAQAQFNTTLLQLKTDVWDNGLEDTYKGMLMFGQDITTGISQLIKRFGLLPPIVATVTAAFGMFGKKLTVETLRKYSTQIKDTSAAIELFNETVGSGKLSAKEFNEQMGTDVSNNFKKYTLSVKGGEASLTGFIAKTALAKAGQLALNVAIAAGEAAISFGITLAIQALVSVIQSWINAQSEAAKSIEEMNSKLDEDNQSLQEYADKYKQLSEELQNGSLTQEEIAKKKQELIEIEQQLVDQFGEEAKTIDLVNGKYDEQIKKINQLAQANFKKYQQENQKEINKLADTFEKVDKKQITFYSNGGKFSDQLKDKFKEAGNSIEAESSRIFNAGQIDVKFSGTIDEIIDKYRQFFDKIKEYRDNVSGIDEDYADLFLEQISNKISELEDKYSEDYETYTTYLEKKLKYDERYSSEYQKIEEARAKVSEAISNGDIENLEKARESLENIYKEAIENAANDKDVSKGMVKILQEQLDEANEYIEKEKIGLKIGIQEEETYQKIQDILNQMGDISSEDLKIMIDTEESTKNLEALKEILDENGISTEEFIENFENLGFTLGDVGEKVNDTTLPSLDALQQSVQNSTQQLADLENSFVSVYNAMEEFNETGYMSASTLQGLIDNNLLQYFDVINGKLAINEAAMANAATAAKVKTAQDLALKAAGEILKIVEDDVTNSVSNTKTQANNTVSPVNKLAEAMLKAGQDGSVAAVGLKEFWAAMQDEDINVSGLSEAAKASINNVLGSFQKSIKALNNVKITATAYTRVSSRSSGSSGSSRASSSSTTQSDAEKAAEEEYKRKLEIWKDFVDNREDAEERWVKKQKELGELSSKDLLYVTQQRITRYNNYLDQIKKMTWLNQEDRLKLEQEYVEQIEDLQLEYFDYLKDILEDQIDELEKARDKQIDNIKEVNEANIKAIKDEAEQRINALRKVENETDRIRSKEEYLKKRQEHLDDIHYWEQRTGREAQEALAEAKKNLKELDDEWQQQLEDWSIEDQIQAIEDQRDAQIQAIEDSEEAQIQAIEEQTQKQIDELQRVYDERVKLFSESNQIIYDNTVIQSEKLYNAYKQNFVDPLKNDLAEIAKQTTNNTSNKSTNSNTTSSPKQEYITYTIKYGDTLSEIAAKYNTTVSKIMAANPSIKNKNLIYAGNTLKIPKFHQGGIFGGIDEGIALLKKGETILKPEWSASLNRMMKYFDNITQKNQTNISSGPTIEVKGDLVKIEANIQNKGDADYLTRKVEKVLKDKFNIKK